MEAAEERTANVTKDTKEILEVAKIVQVSYTVLTNTQYILLKKRN